MPRLSEKDYVAGGGLTCPACETTGEIVGGSIEIDDSSAYQVCNCSKCNAEWTDSYTLTGYGFLTLETETETENGN